MTAGVGGVLRGHRRGAGHRSRRIHRHPGAFRGRAAGRRAGGIATVHDSGAERALCADVAHDLGVEFADLSDDTLAALGELLDDGLDATNPLDVWGTGADTRDLFGACLRRSCRRTRRWPSPPWRSTWSPSTTATPPTPTRCSTSRRTAPMPAGGARVGPVGGRPGDGTTAAGQRRSRARGHAQRAGRAGPPGRLAAVRRRTSGAGRRAATAALADISPPGRWRRSSCSPTTASRLSRSRTAGSLDEALSAADADRLSGGAENRRCTAQDRSRRGGPRASPTTTALRAAYATMSAALGPQVTCRRDGRTPAWRYRSASCDDDAFGPVGGGRRRGDGGTAR